MSLFSTCHYRPPKWSTAVLVLNIWGFISLDATSNMKVVRLQCANAQKIHLADR